GHGRRPLAGPVSARLCAGPRRRPHRRGHLPGPARIGLHRARRHGSALAGSLQLGLASGGAAAAAQAAGVVATENGESTLYLLHKQGADPHGPAPCQPYK
nr:hypothetical protein [Tanacetum cinerariifolium]